MWKQAWIIGPVYIASIILTCLILYRLIKSTQLTVEEKKNIPYYELALSFVASFISIFAYSAFIIHSLSDIIISYKFILLCLLMIILTPFTVTLLRVALQDKLTNQQNDILSGITIPIIVVNGCIGTALAIGKV